MCFGGHCKRYRIFCNAYRKICRPYSGKAMRFPSSAPPCRFSLRGRRRSRFWRENSRCWQGVQFFHTARPQDSEAIQKAPGAASVGAIYAAVNAMNQLGKVHTTVRHNSVPQMQKEKIYKQRILLVKRMAYLCRINNEVE